ncbi:hypothetical protein LX36DRAFT_42869 [Colletotrichum falcatum]|nr:hypothetical protein LX36DRAFT_42869 [Colletotrichum falcatum]
MFHWYLYIYLGKALTRSRAIESNRDSSLRSGSFAEWPFILFFVSDSQFSVWSDCDVMLAGVARVALIVYWFLFLNTAFCICWYHRVHMERSRNSRIRCLVEEEEEEEDEVRLSPFASNNTGLVEEVNHEVNHVASARSHYPWMSSIQHYLLLLVACLLSKGLSDAKRVNCVAPSPGRANGSRHRLVVRSISRILVCTAIAPTGATNGPVLTPATGGATGGATGYTIVVTVTITACRSLTIV